MEVKERARINTSTIDLDGAEGGRRKAEGVLPPTTLFGPSTSKSKVKALSNIIIY